MKPIVFETAHPLQRGGSSHSLGAWLNMLSVLQPPARVVHVGLSDTPSESSAWLQLPLSKALIISADPVALETLKMNAVCASVIEARQQVIAGQEGSVDYFRASNPSESGLVDPTQLRTIWPSLTLAERTKRDATTLDRATAEFLSQSNSLVLKPLWLVVDCLPALPILSGGDQLLQACHLVCVRVIEEAGINGEPDGADLSSVDHFLAEQGFTRLSYLSGLNPRIGHALYGRTQSSAAKEGAAAIEAAQQRERDSLTEKVSQAEQQLTEVQKSAVDAKKTAETLTASLKLTQEQAQATQTNLETALKERISLESRVLELDSKLKSATAQQAESTLKHEQAFVALQTKLTEAQKQLEAQTQAKDKAEQQLAETQKTVDASQKSLAETQKTAEAAQQSLAELQKSAADAKKTAETLSASLKQAQDQAQAAQTKLEAALKERTSLEARVLELDGKLKSATAQQAENALKHEQTLAVLQTKLTEAQKQHEAQTQAKDKAQQQLAESQKTVDVTQKSLVESQKTAETAQKSLVEAQKVAAEAKKSVETTTAALKAKEAALEAELARTKALTAENQDLAHRQQLMNEELVKAEGQISLIKDLLLREPGI